MKQFGPTYNITLVRTGKINCPYALLQNYRNFFDEASVDEYAPGFMDLDGNPYTYKSALKDVRFYLQFIGEDGMDFGTHSFRIGLATEASIIHVEMTAPIPPSGPPRSRRRAKKHDSPCLLPFFFFQMRCDVTIRYQNEVWYYCNEIVQKK
jgi:hypothetical protein